MNKKETKDKSQQKQLVVQIIRMSQKALVSILLMIAVSLIGGLIAIFFEPSVAEPMSEYAKLFIPIFEIEIGVYGAGSTIENVQKIQKQITALKKGISSSEDDEEDDDDDDSNG